MKISLQKKSQLHRLRIIQKQLIIILLRIKNIWLNKRFLKFDHWKTQRKLDNWKTIVNKSQVMRMKYYIIIFLKLLQMKARTMTILWIFCHQNRKIKNWRNKNMKIWSKIRITCWLKIICSLMYLMILGQTKHPQKYW